MTDASPRWRQFSSEGPYEARLGYSRALRTGDRILVEIELEAHVGTADAVAAPGRGT